MDKDSSNRHVPKLHVPITLLCVLLPHSFKHRWKKVFKAVGAQEVGFINYKLLVVNNYQTLCIVEPVPAVT